jgi:gliding motility-associated-like protein
LNNGAIEINPPPPGYTYAWSNAALSGNNPMNLGAGTFTVTVTETATGCRASSSFTLNASSGLTAGANITQTSCGQDNGAITVTPAGAGFTYNWGDIGLSSSIRTNLSPGNYVVTVTNTVGGCASSTSITINSSVPFSVGSNVTQTSCGQDNGAITVTPAPPGYTYAWAGSGITTNIRTGLAAGDYTVTVTQTTSGCISTASITINPSTPFAIGGNITQASCGNNNGAISVTPAPPGYTYAWAGSGVTTNIRTSLGAGDYTVTVTETATGCKSSSIFTITSTGALVLNLIVSQPSCGLNNGAIEINPPPPGYTYAWSNAALSGNNPMNLGAGTFTVTVTETATGCRASSSFTLNASSGLTAGANITQTSCGQDNGAITVTPAGAGFTYNWGDIGLSSSTRTNLASGNYVVTVTNTVGGCASSTSITINSSMPFSVGSNVSQTSCGQDNGAISVTPAPPGYTYAWAGSGITTNIRTGLAAGDYTVTVTQTTSGCKSTASITINPSIPFAIGGNITQASCGNNNGAISVTPAPPGYSYAWAGSGVITNIRTGLGAGDYTVTVTETATGCKSSSIFTITSTGALVLNPIVSQPSCGLNNGAIEINPPPPGYSYAWSNAALSGNNPMNLGAGTFTVTVTETATGCRTSSSFTLNASSGLTAGANITQTSCGQDNGAITVTPAGAGFTYNWGDIGLSSSIRTNLAPGNYIVTVTNTVGGCASSTSITINGSTPFSVGSNVTQTSCGQDNGAISVTPAPPGYSYAWAGSGITTDSRTGLAAGDYTVTVTQTASGCKSTTTITINPSTPFAIGGNITQASCGNNNGAIAVSPAPPGYTYAWAGSGVTSNIRTGLGAGDYTVTVTETSTGCRSSSTFTITSTGALVLNPIVSQPSCGLNNGAVEINPPPPGYTYVWSNAALSGNNPMNLGAGTFTVTVTETATGCRASSSFTLNASSGLTAGANITQTSCGQDNGAITVTPTGAGFTYNWGDIGFSSSIRTNLAPGNYVVTVTNTVGGCAASTGFTINGSTNLSISFNGINPSCGLNNGSISVTPNGVGYSYTWQGLGNPSGANPNNLSAGTYSVTVSDIAAGCSSVSFFVLTASQGLNVSGSLSNPSCGLNNGSISVTPNGVGYSYIWQGLGNASGANPTNLSGGTYTVTVTDIAAGCSSVSSFVLTASQGLNVSGSLSNPSCGLNNGSISVTPNGVGYSFTWQGLGNPSGANPNSLSAGTYSVTVTDIAAGCSSASSFILVASPGVSLNCLQKSPASSGANADGIGSVFISGGAAPYTILWVGPSSGQQPGVLGENSVNGLVSGAYSVVVRDGNNCSANCGFSITNSACTLNASSRISSPISCFGLSDGKVELTVNQGIGTVNVNWSNGQNSTSVNNLSQGTYRYTVTDGIGCKVVDSISLIAPLPINFNINIDSITCLTRTGTIRVTSITNGTPPYKYSFPAGQPFTNFNGSLSLNNLIPGTHILTIQDERGCQIRDTVVFDSVSGLTVDLPDLVEIELGESVQLIAITNKPTSQISQWNWSSGPKIFNNNSDILIDTPKISGTYRVRVTDLMGCTSEDLVNVIVKKNIKIYIPNAFSPNGDGINDVFRIYSDDLKIEKVNYLRIFDRWGNMVHEEKDFTINGTQKGWNGTFKLLQMKPDVFVYSTEITLLDGSIIKKTGDVTLVE